MYRDHDVRHKFRYKVSSFHIAKTVQNSAKIGSKRIVKQLFYQTCSQCLNIP